MAVCKQNMMVLTPFVITVYFYAPSWSQTAAIKYSKSQNLQFYMQRKNETIIQFHSAIYHILELYESVLWFRRQINDLIQFLVDLRESINNQGFHSLNEQLFGFYPK